MNSTPVAPRFPVRLITLGALGGLAAGFLSGAFANQLGVPAGEAVGAILESVAAVWVNALQMTIIPLVTSYIIVAIASDDPKSVGRMGSLSLGLFVVMLITAGMLTLAIGTPLVRLLILDPEVAAALRETASGFAQLAPTEIPETPTLHEWIVGLVPSNAIGAAARGEYLPLILFTVLFGLAATRIPTESRERLIGLFRAIAETSIVLVRWVLFGIPIAAFAIAYPVALRSGLGVVGPILFYLATVCGLMLLFTAIIYPLTAILGRVSIVRFARSLLPAQAVAVGSRSSLASLPPMLDSAERLGLPTRVSGFVLPLAVSTFKLNRTITAPYKLLFMAHLYGVALDPAYMIVFVLTATMLSFSSPGVPSGGTMITLPFYLAAGVPVEGVVLLRAVDAIPDIFKTLINVTADMSVATVVARTGETADPAGAVAVSTGQAAVSTRAVEPASKPGAA